MLDAYTIRKAVPRILLAAIGINVSIYLCVAMIDITNIVGGGLADLIVSPFRDASAFGNASLGGNLAGVGLGLTLLAGGATGLWAAGGIAGAGLALLALLVPIVISLSLITLAIIFTLVIRQGLIIFLTIVSPVAIALFVLPGTEKYFKKWLDLYIKSLLVYPIVASIFAVSTAMVSILVGTADADAAAIGFSKSIAAIIVAFLPLVMIPFAFKLAGGAIGAVMNAGAARAGGISGRAAKGYAGMRQNPNSLIGGLERDIRKNKIDSRAQRYDRGVRQSGIRGRFNRLAGGKRSAALQAIENEESEKTVTGTAANGNDTYYRAATLLGRDLDAMVGTNRWRNDNGYDEFMDASGTWHSRDTIRASASIVKSRGDFQAAYKHVLSKTENLPPEYQQMLLSDFLSYGNATNLDSGSAVGTWAGISIPNQRIAPDLRHTSIRGDTGNLRAEGNHVGLLNMIGSEKGFAMADHGEGSAQAFVEAYRAQATVRERLLSEGRVDEARVVQDRMANARENIKKYLGAERSPNPAIIAAQQAAQQAAQPGGGSASGGAQAGYGSASSASHKTEQAWTTALSAVNDIDFTLPIPLSRPESREYSGGRTGDHTDPRNNQTPPA